MKKIISLICAAALLLSLCACGKKSEYAGSAVTVKVTAIKNGNVTLQLGELSEEDNGSRPEMPDSAPPSAAAKALREQAAHRPKSLPKVIRAAAPKAVKIRQKPPRANPTVATPRPKNPWASRAERKRLTQVMKL